MTRYLTERHTDSRARFHAWLTPMLGEVSTASIAVEYARLSNSSGNYRHQIKAIAQGKSSAGPARAFWIGEALRELGESQANGLVALYASANYGTLLDLFERMTREQQGELEFVSRTGLYRPTIAASLAVRMYCALPVGLHALDFGIQNSTEYIPNDALAAGKFEDEHGVAARSAFVVSAEEHKALRDHFLKRRQVRLGGLTHRHWFVRAKGALAIRDLPPREARDLAWADLLQWAQDSDQQTFVQNNAGLDAFYNYREKRASSTIYLH